MKPQMHQKATFYPMASGGLVDSIDMAVTRVHSDMYVDLRQIDKSGVFIEGIESWSATSVLVFDPESGQTKPTGHYCVLQPLAEPEQLVQPKITGYRQLSDEDAALMNEIKAQGEVLSQLLSKVAKHLAGQHVAGQAGNAELAQRHTLSEPHRWMAMARSDLQAGLMKLTRAVAQPSGF